MIHETVCVHPSCDAFFFDAYWEWFTLQGPHCLLTWVCKYLSVTTYLLFLIPPPASMAILCSEYAEVFKYFKQAGGFALSGAMCGVLFPTSLSCK